MQAKRCCPAGRSRNDCCCDYCRDDHAAEMIERGKDAEIIINANNPMSADVDGAAGAMTEHLRQSRGRYRY